VKLALALVFAVGTSGWAQTGGGCRAPGSDPDASIAACTQAIALAKAQKSKCEEELVWADSVRHPNELPDSATAVPDCPGGYVPTDGLKDAYVARGESFLAKRQYGMALSDLRQSNMLAPRDASIYSVMGRIYEQAGQSVKAAAAYGRAVRLDPAASAGWTGRCRVRMKLGKLAQAKVDCARALALAPDDAETLAASRMAMNWGSGGASK
jgi:tetratricopeptide (TPR) repeat protein